MDRFTNMETFVKVVDIGSISGAASHMNIAKSAVSRRLKELEEHLNVQLFHRTTRTMHATETGNAYYRYCIRILEDLQEAEAMTSQAHCEIKGSIKIAMPSTFGVMHIGCALNDFLALHPQIQFELDFNDRQVDIVQEGFDIAIRIANLPDSTMLARKLASIRHVLCASPEYLKQYGEPLTPTQLSEHKTIVYSLSKDLEHWRLVTPDGEKIKVKLNPTLKCSSGEYLLSAAECGLGIAHLPTFVTHEAIREGRLNVVLPGYAYSELNVYAVYPHTRHLSRRVRTLIDFLVARFEGTPYWDR